MTRRIPHAITTEGLIVSLDKPANKDTTCQGCQGCYFYGRRHNPLICSVNKELDAGINDSCENEDNLAFVWQEVKDE